MDEFIARCIAHIQSIIDRLHADLDSMPEDVDIEPIRAAIQRFEDTLHQLHEK